MSLIIPANSAAAGGGFEATNSLMFNSADSAYLARAQGTATGATKYTLSMWIKRSKLGAEMNLIGVSSGNTIELIKFNADNSLRWYNRDASSNAAENTAAGVFRDISAWYSLVFSYDSTQSGAANQRKIYINGVNQTWSSANAVQPNAVAGLNLSGATINIGAESSPSNYFGGYMSEVNFIDGQALTADSFGEFDEDSGIWKPIDASGLTFGNNGFYLNFEDSANLGNDATGGTDFSENNIAAGDQSDDTCTNNYNLLNSNNIFGRQTLSEGNTKFTGDSGYNHQGTLFGVNKGKWYVEIKDAQTRSKVFMLSLYNVENTIHTNASAPWFGNGLGLTTFYLQLQNTNHASTRDYTFRKMVGSTQTTVTSTGGNLSGLSVGIIGVYIDMDNKRIHFYNNGSALDGHNAGSSTAGLGPIPAGTYSLGLTDANNPGDGGNDGVLLMNWNFGSPNPNNIPSSGNTDANEYGNFEYSPTVGGVDYYAMNTKNLAEFG